MFYKACPIACLALFVFVACVFSGVRVQGGNPILLQNKGVSL
jgi:hypothetical protein